MNRDRRERIVLPGEKAPPDAAGPVVPFELHRIRQMHDAMGTPSVGLDMRQADGTRILAVVPAMTFFELAIKILNHNGYDVVPRAGGVKGDADGAER